MINNKASTIPSFTLHSHVLIPVLHRNLSGDPHRKIVLSKSLSIHKSLIIPIEKADSESFTLEDFLLMLDMRIKTEFAYQEEIICLRNDIRQEYNKLCKDSNDNSFIKFVKEQEQLIINTLFEEAKIEDKAVAERFYYTLMKNSEKEILSLQQFSETLHAVLWKPLLTPFPVGALDMLKKYKGDGEKKSNAEIEKVTSKIVEHIKFYMRAQEVKDKNFNSSQELKAMLEEISKERKICNIEISNVIENENVVTEFRGRCIEKIILAISIDEFLKNKSKIGYDELKLDGVIKKINAQMIFDHFQRTIITLDFRIGEAIFSQMKKSFSKLKFLKHLTLRIWSNDLKDEGTKSESAAVEELKELTSLENILSLSLDIEFYNIRDEGAKALSASLKKLKNFPTLNLNFFCKIIGNEGVAALSTSLKELKNMSTFNLNIRQLSRVIQLDDLAPDILETMVQQHYQMH